MTQTYNVAGAAAISLGLYGGGLTPFGFSIDGVSINENPILYDIPVDSEGGEGSAPGEIQMLNMTHTIRMEMSKYDLTVANAIRAWNSNSANAGVVPSPGTLVFGNSLTVRVLINAPNDVRNYPICVLREPIDQNRGTKFSRLVLIATAYRNQSTSVIWNVATS